MYKVALLDEDKEYLKLVSNYFKKKNIEILCYESSDEFYAHNDKKMDLIIVNENLSKDIVSNDNVIVICETKVNNDEQKVYKYQDFENIFSVIINKLNYQSGKLFRNEILIFNISHDHYVKNLLDKYLILWNKYGKIFKWNCEVFSDEDYQDGMDLNMAINANQYLSNENYINKLNKHEGVYSFYPVKTSDIYFEMSSDDYAALTKRLFEIGMQNMIIIVDEYIPCFIEYILSDFDEIVLIYKENDRKKEEKIKRWIKFKARSDVKIMERKINGNKRDEALIASLTKEI